ncbi:MAG: hypothetical protein ACYTFA_06525 [Planctomycetota bacterium]
MRACCLGVMVILSAAAMLAAGCPAVIEEVSPARQACLDLGFSDDNIDALFDATEAQQDDGSSLLEAFDLLVAVCRDACGEDATCVVDCQECTAAVVDQVYDE